MLTVVGLTNPGTRKSYTMTQMAQKDANILEYRTQTLSLFVPSCNMYTLYVNNTGYDAI